MADHPKSKSMGGMGKAKLKTVKSMSLPTCEICGGMVFWAWLEPEVGDGARLGADGHAHHVLHLVDAVALRAAPGQLGEPLALPDQDEPLREVLQGAGAQFNR